MTERELLPPTEQNLITLEYAISMYGATVENGQKIPAVPDEEIREMVRQHVSNEQAQRLGALLRISDVFDWDKVIHDERHARHELEAATELVEETERQSHSALVRIEHSVVLASEIAPELSEKISEIAEQRKQSIHETSLKPAQEFQDEWQQKLTDAENTFARAGRAWAIPNLTEIPRSAVPIETQQAAEESVTSELPDASSLVEEGNAVTAFIETISGLSSREKQMLAIILESIESGTTFKRSDLDFTGVTFASFEASEGAFTRLTRKLAEAGIVTPLGKAGGRKYELHTLIPTESTDDDTDQQKLEEVPLQSGAEGTIELTSPAEVEAPLITEEAPLHTTASDPRVETQSSAVEDEPKIKYVQSISSGRLIGESRVSEGTLSDLFRHLKIKDPQYVTQAMKWVEWLFENPQSTASRKIRSFNGIRVGGILAYLYRFSPRDAQGLSVPREYMRERIVYALLENQPVIVDILNHDAFDRKYK